MTIMIIYDSAHTLRNRPGMAGGGRCLIPKLIKTSKCSILIVVDELHSAIYVKITKARTRRFSMTGKYIVPSSTLTHYMTKIKKIIILSVG